MAGAATGQDAGDDSDWDSEISSRLLNSLELRRWHSDNLLSSF